MPYSDRRIPFPRPRLTPVPYLWWWTARLHARSLYGINRPWSSVFNPKDNCNFCTRPWPKFPVYNSRCESLFLHLHGPLLHLPLFLPFFSRWTKVLVQRVLAIRGDRVRLSSGVLAFEIHQLERVGLKQWSHHDLDLHWSGNYIETVVHLHVLRVLEGGLHHHCHLQELQRIHPQSVIWQVRL